MRDITKEELKAILENHKYWINEEPEGCDDMRADLSGADLRYADLTGANLECANLYNTLLIGANLSGANLYNALLRSADLEYANLNDADLRGVSLKCANLFRADLINANLSNANLEGAGLVDTDLRYANLRGANLENANLNNADLNGAKNIPYIPMICPDTGAFVGWKACKDKVLVKLLIPEDAKRSSATGRKCRCNKAIVLDIEGADIAYSYHDNKFVYRKGETVTVKNFDDNRFALCSTGIHFFINKEEAIGYAKQLR